jgi:lipopolysaccharide transport system permease protein
MYRTSGATAGLPSSAAPYFQTSTTNRLRRAMSIVTQHAYAAPISAPKPRVALRRIEPDRGWPKLGLGELFEHAELLGFFVWRDIKVRYKQTVFGVAWAVLQPLATMVVFSVVFGRLAKLDSDGVPYPAFCLAGLLPWMLFASGLTQSANSLVGNVNLLNKVYFPRMLLPIANVAAGLVDLCVALPLLFVVLVWCGVMPGWNLLLLPLPLALVVVTATGGGLWLAAANAQYRDIRFVLPFLVQLWMYGTPIVYSFHLIPNEWQAAVAINPLVSAVGLFRFAVLGVSAPGAPAVAVSIGSAIALLVSGGWYFRATERSFIDTI